LAIISCPVCGRGGLRIPDDRRGKVTCPSCGAEWFYPEIVEINEVEFRCAHNGARFIVQLARRSPLHKFVIQAVKGAPAPTSKTSTEAASDSVSTEADTSITMIPARRSEAPQLARPGGLLSRLMGKAVEVASPTQDSGDGVAKADSKENLYPTCHEAREYWSSFFCPYCNATGFIRCHGGHFACDGTVQIRNGRRFHQCFCGDAGFIEGEIKSYEVKEATFSVDPVTPKPRKTESAIVPQEPSKGTLSSPTKENNKRLLS
jgi:hypothetical protein